MGAGRKTSTYSYDSASKIQPQRRGLAPELLRGVIFGATYKTVNECLENRLFGLPYVHIDYVRHIHDGMPLFLFNYTDKKLHGVFEADGDGDLEIDPNAWANVRKNPHVCGFPAQVRTRVLHHCDPLEKQQYHPVLAGNSYEGHYMFELDEQQTNDLIVTFLTRKPPKRSGSSSSSSASLPPERQQATPLPPAPPPAVNPWSKNQPLGSQPFAAAWQGSSSSSAHVPPGGGQTVATGGGQVVTGAQGRADDAFGLPTTQTISCSADADESDQGQQKQQQIQQQLQQQQQQQRQKQQQQEQQQKHPQQAQPVSESQRRHEEKLKKIVVEEEERKKLERASLVKQLRILKERDALSNAQAPPVQAAQFPTPEHYSNVRKNEAPPPQPAPSSIPSDPLNPFLVSKALASSAPPSQPSSQLLSKPPSQPPPQPSSHPPSQTPATLPPNLASHSPPTPSTYEAMTANSSQVAGATSSQVPSTTDSASSAWDSGSRGASNLPPSGWLGGAGAEGTSALPEEGRRTPVQIILESERAAEDVGVSANPKMQASSTFDASQVATKGMAQALVAQLRAEFNEQMDRARGENLNLQAEIHHLRNEQTQLKNELASMGARWEETQRRLADIQQHLTSQYNSQNPSFGSRPAFVPVPIPQPYHPNMAAMYGTSARGPTNPGQAYYGQQSQLVQPQVNGFPNAGTNGNGHFQHQQASGNGGEGTAPPPAEAGGRTGGNGPLDQVQYKEGDLNGSSSNPSVNSNTNANFGVNVDANANPANCSENGASNEPHVAAPTDDKRHGDDEEEDEHHTVLSNAAPQLPDIYLLGGSDGAVLLPDTVVYQPSRNEMQQGTPLPVQRSYLAAAALNGRIYVFGGSTNGSGTPWCNTVESFSKETGVWTACEPMKRARGSLGGAACQDHVYAFGGAVTETGASRLDALDVVEYYAPERGEWNITVKMNDKRFCCAGSELGGAIYALGGYDGTRYLNTVERFDPREGVWAYVTPMKYQRGSLAATVLSQSLYAVGGFDGMDCLNTMEVYDVRSNRWYDAPAMSTKRAYGVAEVSGSHVYTFGGLYGNQSNMHCTTVESFSSLTGQWQALSSFKRTFLASAVL